MGIQIPALPNPSKILRSQRGVALMMAIIATMMIFFIVSEISYETAVEHVVASQQVRRIQAYYAAKSGLELSLLRIQLYKQAMAAFGDTLGANKNMLDPIWKFPFTWPPVIGGEVSGVDQNMIKDVVAESLMQAQYATTIVPEGTKFDINDLGSDIKALKLATERQILQIFETELQNNEAFRKKYATERFGELVNNITDYIDEDKEGSNGGDESSPYRDIVDPNLTLPPNRALRTIDELHQVAGMKDDFYNLLAPRITVYGTKGVNVNYAPREVLMALEPITMKPDIVDKIIERRENPNLDGPFKDENDFFNFAQGLGVNVREIQQSGVPLLFDMEFNFRVTSTGLSGNVKREISAVVYDYANLAQRLADMADKQDQQGQGQGQQQQQGAQTGIGTSSPQQGQPGTGSTSQTKAKIQLTKGRPSIVYWEEN